MTQNTSALLLDEILAGQGIGLSAAAKLIPGDRGRPCSPATVWRWAKNGVDANGNKIKLEVARIASRWVTSANAIRRFLERQNPVQVDQSNSTPPPATIIKPANRRRQDEIDAARAELRSLGI